MRVRRGLGIATILLVTVSAGPAPPVPVVEYRGMCNASAAIGVGGGRFLVADDEDKPETFLRLYREGQPSGPLAAIPLPNDALGLDPGEDFEVDIEGAAPLGDRVYWIGSHSASKEGKSRTNRRRLFATHVKVEGTGVRVEVVGEPYKHLIRDLDGDRDYAPFHLKEAAKKAPKEPGALSIEGLAGTPGGDLLIGFRNPVPGGTALVVTLKNPKGVTNGKPASFGPPIRLDLGGLGIRSLEWSDALGEYLIVGGQPGEGGGSRLFRWSGKPDKKPHAISDVDFTGLNPEALYVEGTSVVVLSDDGRRKIDGEARDCAAPGARKSFRGVRIALTPP